MNQTFKKLSLFGLGYKPMKKVIAYHPDWTKDVSFSKIGNEPKDTENWNPDIYIETIPELVTLSSFEKNFDSLALNDILWKDAYITWYEEIYWEMYECSE